MAEDDDALSFLGDLALQDVLSSVGINADGLENVGLAARSSSKAKQTLDRGDIFKDNYDSDEEGDEDGDDDDGLSDEQESRPQLAAPLPLLPRIGRVPSLPPPPPPPPPPAERSIEAVFPSFTPDGVLDFVGLFGGDGPSGLHPSQQRQQGRRKKAVRITDAILPPMAAIEPVKDDVYNPSAAHAHMRALLPADARGRSSAGRWGDVLMLSSDEDEDWEDEGMDEDEESPPPQTPRDGPSLRPPTSTVSLAELGRLVARESMDDSRFRGVELEQWEDGLINGPPPAKRRRPNMLTPFNALVESGDWVRGIVWDATDLGGPTVGGGPTLEAVVEEEGEGLESMPLQPAGPPKKVPKPVAHADPSGAPAPVPVVPVHDVDPYNISNDHHYEGMKHRVRQTFGSIVVQHAYPALKLQLPFYKTSLTKQELRAWHRPPLQFQSNIRFTFDVSPPARKLKDKVGRKLGKGGDVQEGLRRVGDLTLRDKSDFVLWEFSEENPPVMSGFGMGSVLVNYYRKKTDDDDHIPKLELGEPFVLDPKDEPPYSTFAPIDKGATQQTLYNNMIKAPLFKHKPAETDFLCVRVTYNGSSHYFIREIKNLFVVGQTIPSVQIPGPHARKVSATAKDRTHQIAYRLLQKAKGNHMKLSRLMKYFPDCHELQMRQRLKDFLEFHRKGIHQQTWRLKVGLKFPDPAEYLKMVDPESVMMVESMAVGRQHLQDSGYGTSEKDEKNEDESKMDSEQKLAPWIMTKTYLHSQRDKAWVQLYGEGDPTGRGEGFSFIKVSMKDIFLREGETAEDRKAYIATLPKSQQKQGHTVQEQIFRLEARRIWDAQVAALSSPTPPELTEEEEYPEQAARGRASISVGPGGRSGNDDGWDGAPSSPGYSAFSSGNTPRPRSPGGMSRASSMDRDDAMSVGSGRQTQKGEGSRVLKIKRLINGKWKTEIVRDINIINAYIRKRQIIEEKGMAAEAVAPTGDADKDKRMQKFLQEEIEKLKKNQTRRLNRKKALADSDKPVTSRKCANCGAVGHMKTNRKCPRWAEFNLTQKNAPDLSGPMGLGGIASSGAVDHLPQGFFVDSPATVPAPARHANLASAETPKPSGKIKLSLGKKH